MSFPKTPSIQKLCWLSAWLMYAAPICSMVVWAYGHRSARSAAAILVTAMLVAFISASCTRKWRVFFFAQFPFCLIGLVFVAYTLAFAMPPGHTLATLLVGTSKEELAGFLGLPEARRFFLSFAAWSVCYILAASFLGDQRIFAAGSKRLRVALILLVLPAACYAAASPNELIDGIALNPIVGSVIFLGGDIPRVHQEMRGSSIHKIPYGASRSGGEEVHILVLGESARRDSWQVYGYTRPTTPYLTSISNEAVFLQRATADANLTAWAVPILLTGLSPEEFDISRVRGNIFDLAREGGYRTALLVNQDIGISIAAGIEADLLEFPPDFKGNINGRHSLDEALLPAYRREASRAGKPRFIGIHMMGSHWEYFNRYPPGFRRFGASTDSKKLSMLSVLLSDDGSESLVLDAYDNTVLYADWFLQQVIEQARSLPVPATVTFFPDHGEDLQLLDGSTGHGAPFYTRHAFEIPAFVWANDAYRRLHPAQWAAIKANSGREIRSHDLFYSLADMMGIDWPGKIQKRSFASLDFVPDSGPRIAGGKLIAGSINEARVASEH